MSSSLRKTARVLAFLLAGLAGSSPTISARANEAFPNSSGDFPAYCEKDLANCNDTIASMAVRRLLEHPGLIDYCFAHLEVAGGQLSDQTLKKIEGWMSSHQEYSVEQGLFGAMKQYWPPPC